MRFDLVVIGGGPGGYVAAIRAAQLGLKVACIDMRKTFGGTCLNVGCIPSKALLQSSEKYYSAQKHLSDHGVVFGDIQLDLNKLMSRKTKIVDDLTKGISFLFKKNKITPFYAKAQFQNEHQLRLTNPENNETQIIEFASAIIATGSESIDLPGIKVDERQIVSSTGALSLEQVPKTLTILGGGYIGLELGSVWARLGSKVTVVEFMDRICPQMDLEISAALQKTLEKQGLNFRLNTKVLSAKANKEGVTFEVESQNKEKTPQIEKLLIEKLQTDVLLVSIGRRPYTEGLGLEKIGLQLDNRGRIQVDSHYRTSQAHIFAIGDVIKGPMLAHKAEEEGVAVAEIISGQKPHVNYETIPGVVYTHPEVATLGKTEEELKAENIPYKTGKFPLSANSRARAMGESEGFVKILAHRETDTILGVHIIGAEAGTMIAEAVLAMEYSASSEDIARICHAHPTLNEAFKEAALAVDGRAIHM
jgi:dihydrolipoamide dehydrogenase